MQSDFIQDSDLNPETVKIEGKHKALFRMSDLAQNRGLTALRDGLVSVLPLAVISTILYILIAAYDLIFKYQLTNLLSISASSGEGLSFSPENFVKLAYISPYLVFCALIPVFFSVAFTYELSRKYRSGDAIQLGLVSGAVTFITLYSPFFMKAEAEVSIMEFPMNLMAGHPEFLSGGIFVALLVSLLNYGLYRLMVRKGIASPLPVNVSDALQGGFRVVLPGLIAALIMIALVVIVREPFGQAVYLVSKFLFRGLDNIFALIVIVVLVQIFAFFGIHGASSVYSIFWVILLSGSVDPPVWGEGSASDGFATLSTVFFFVMIGGTGGTLSLNLAMLRARSEQVKKLGSMTLIPSLMNSNDLIIYGLPLAFNRHLLIPFFLVPLLNLGIAYTAVATGLMQAPSLLVPPYIPAPLGAFLACGGDWYAILVCMASILIGAAIYSYFLIPYDFRLREIEEIPDDPTFQRRNPV